MPEEKTEVGEYTPTFITGLTSKYTMDHRPAVSFSFGPDKNNYYNLTAHASEFRAGKVWTSKEQGWWNNLSFSLTQGVKWFGVGKEKEDYVEVETAEFDQNNHRAVLQITGHLSERNSAAARNVNVRLVVSGDAFSAIVRRGQNK